MDTGANISTMPEAELDKVKICYSEEVEIKYRGLICKTNSWLTRFKLGKEWDKNHITAVVPYTYSYYLLGLNTLKTFKTKLTWNFPNQTVVLEKQQ